MSLRKFVNLKTVFGLIASLCATCIDDHQAICTERPQAPRLSRIPRLFERFAELREFRSVWFFSLSLAFSTYSRRPLSALLFVVTSPLDSKRLFWRVPSQASRSSPSFPTPHSFSMASPPYKMSKLSHDLNKPPSTLANSASKLSLNSSSAPPPPSGKKRLGLSSGLEKNGSKKLTLKAKRKFYLYSCSYRAHLVAWLSSSTFNFNLPT